MNGISSLIIWRLLEDCEDQTWITCRSSLVEDLKIIGITLKNYLRYDDDVAYRVRPLGILLIRHEETS